MLNVGFVGCGGFVQGNHLPNTAANPQLNIYALCDLNEQVLSDLASRYAPRYVTSNADRIFADAEIDMVVIGTKPNTRLSLIRSAAITGKPVYVEKPLSVGWDDSLAILQTLKEHPTLLQVGFNRPYSPIMQEARRIFDKQRGEVSMISYRICGEFLLFPQHHKETLTLRGESGIIHEVVHIFDLLNWFLRSEPYSIYCSGGENDDNILVLEYPRNTHVCILASNTSTEGFPKERMEVFTNHSTLVMNEFLELQVAQIPGESDQFFPLKSALEKEPMTEGTPDGGASILLSEAELRQQLKEWRLALRKEEIATGYYYGSRPCVNKGHYEALDHFRHCVEEGRSPETDAWHGVLATIMGLEALRSLRKGCAVNLDLTSFESYR